MRRCCICGTVRNCARYLDRVFQNMEQIGAVFDEYVILLYYDQSHDDTLQKMKNYQEKNPNFHFFVNQSKMLPFRTYRIALGRNALLQTIRQHYSEYEYFIMMDCDNRCASKIKTNILQRYLTRGDWDSLSFNHPNGYYDTWALSIFPFLVSFHHYRDIGVGQRFITKKIQMTPKNRLIPCLSAFNGFAIYRTKKFLNCRYDGRERLGAIPRRLLIASMRYTGALRRTGRREDCEHRFFHMQAFTKNRAKIRIAPVCVFS